MSGPLENHKYCSTSELSEGVYGREGGMRRRALSELSKKKSSQVTIEVNYKCISLCKQKEVKPLTELHRPVLKMKKFAVNLKAVFLCFLSGSTKA